MTRSTLGFLHIIFHLFVSEVWPLIYAKILFLFNILRTNGQNFTKFYICIHINKIYVGIVTHNFLHICSRVTCIALDLRQNLVSIQYLENKWTEFYQIIYIYIFILTRYTLGLLHIIFLTFVPELWALIYAKIYFPFNILRRNGQNFTIFYLCNHIIIDKIYHHFLLICTRVIALDLL